MGFVGMVEKSVVASFSEGEPFLCNREQRAWKSYGR
jgi:hypothetical protein